MTPFLENFLARAFEARPTAAPPYRARLLAPVSAEGPAVAPSTRPAAGSRGHEPAPQAPPVYGRKLAAPQAAAPAAKPAPQRSEGRTPEAERERPAAPPTSTAPVANLSRPDPAAPEGVASETLVVKTRASPQGAETVGLAFEAAVARVFAADAPSAPPLPPAGAPTVVTSIVIGRVELTAAPAAAPPRAAATTRAPMSLDEYLARRGEAGR